MDATIATVIEAGPPDATVADDDDDAGDDDAGAEVSKPQPVRSYHIGNSLTWDARVRFYEEWAAALDLDLVIGHHIWCSRSLPDIVDDPSQTCVDPEPATWDLALQSQWDVVTMQLHATGGATFEQDVSSAVQVVEHAQRDGRNADTRFYIYVPWPMMDALEQWGIDVSPESDTLTIHNAQYGAAVAEAVASQTGAEVRALPMGGIFHTLGQLADQGMLAEATSHEALYRDDVHASIWGQYAVISALWATIWRTDPDTLPVELVEPSIEFSDNDISHAYAAIVQDVVADVLAEWDLP